LNKFLILGLIPLFLLVPGTAFSDSLPDWVKNTAGWWADDSLTELEFMQSIQFLIEQKIISLPSETISELKNDGKKRTFIIPEKDNYEILISGIVPNYDPLKSLHVKIIKPDESSIGILSVPVGNTKGEFSQSFKIYPFSMEGEYKVVSSSEGKTYVIETFLVKKQISSEVPAWIKNTAGWWAQDQIGDTEFISGVEFLIKNQIIQVGPEVLGITPKVYTIDNYQAGCRTPDNMDGMCFEKISEQTFDEIIKNESAKIDSLESLLPNTQNMVDLRENDFDWESIETYDQTAFGMFTSIKDSTGMVLWNLPKSELHNLEDYVDFNRHVKIDYGLVEIYQVNTPTELERFWLHVFDESPYPVFSDDLTGECFSYVDEEFNTISIGCSKGTFGILTTGYSPTDLTHSAKISGFLMDVVLEKINKINGKSYDVSILNVLDYDTYPDSQSTDSVSTSSTQGFSGLYCKQDGNWIDMTGRYTNGPDSYSTIYFTLGILDHNDRIVATGTGLVSNIGPYQTKMFEASAEWSGNFKECIIEINTAYP